MEDNIHRPGLPHCLNHSWCFNPEAGPLVWVPPLDGDMTYATPRHIVISEKSGPSLDGANRWAGLEEELHELSSHFWTNDGLALNTHRCDECVKTVPMAGGLWPLHSIVLDGFTSLRHARCAVPGCEEDLRNYNADRCGKRCHAGVHATVGRVTTAAYYWCFSLTRTCPGVCRSPPLISVDVGSQRHGETWDHDPLVKYLDRLPRPKL